MRKRLTWSLSTTPLRKRRVKAIAQEMRKRNGENISDSEVVGRVIDEKFRALGLTDEEPAGETAGATGGENVAGS